MGKVYLIYEELVYMNHTLKETLWDFSSFFIKAWRQKYTSYPSAEGYDGLASPCLFDEKEKASLWQPKKREQCADFSNVEHAIALKLHEDIKTFYASQFCADLPALFSPQEITGDHEDVKHQDIELIQVWSDEDLARLQENILGHLLMQKNSSIPLRYLLPQQKMKWKSFLFVINQVK